MSTYNLDGLDVIFRKEEKLEKYFSFGDSIRNEAKRNDRSMETPFHSSNR